MLIYAEILALAHHPAWHFFIEVAILIRNNRVKMHGYKGQLMLALEVRDHGQVTNCYQLKFLNL